MKKIRLCGIVAAVTLSFASPAIAYATEQTDGPSTVAAETESVEQTGTETDNETLAEGADASSVESVEAGIDAIPDIVTLADKDQVADARSAYEALSDEEKQRVGNLHKLQSAEEQLDDLEENSVYHYTFVLTEQKPQSILTIQYSDGSLKLYLVDPDGEEFTVPETGNRIEGKDFYASISRSDGEITIDITNGKEGNWTLSSSSPISFQSDGYLPETTEETTEQISGQGSGIAFNPDFLKLGLLVVIVVAAMAVIFKARKNIKEGGNEKPAKKKKKYKDDEINIEQTATPADEKQILMDDINQFWNDYKNEQMKNEPEDAKQPTRKSPNQEKVEEVFITQEDIDNDYTVEEFLENADSDPEQKEQKTDKKARKRRSFFPEDRFQ